MSKIEWTERTWNPIVGCSVVSPGCTNCYAMRMAARLEAMGTRGYAGLTQPSKAGPVWTGKVGLVESALTLPLRTRKPTTWFVNSMSDLFHESVPDEWIDRVFAVMALCPQHTFQVLTKRSARMRVYMADSEVPEHLRLGRMIRDDPDEPPIAWPLPNVWLGVSAEDQRRADERVPDLLATPAAVRFVSAGPLLGPIDFTTLQRPSPLGSMSALRDGSDKWPRAYLDWIIVGGESGHGARAMSPAWARSIRDQCDGAGVAFHFKQWGEWAPKDANPSAWPSEGFSGMLYDAFSFSDATVHRLGKKAAGRLLDGVEHNGMPEARA